METILQVPCMEMSTRDPNEMQNLAHDPSCLPLFNVPFGVTYEKIGTIQRRGFFVFVKDFTVIPGVVNHSIYGKFPFLDILIF